MARTSCLLALLLLVAVAAAAEDAEPSAKESAATAQSSGAVRTLDEISIEGEIAVPQVLFITAKDRARYRDGLGLSYLPRAAELGRQLPVPTRVLVRAKKEE